MTVFPLSYYICKQFVPEKDSCTSISKNISNNFIEIAGSRIFENKDRAFLELPLNSIDAYRSLRGEPSIGKFGMGFYSIFIFFVWTS